MEHDMSSTLFVSGASGQLGRLVVQDLLERGCTVVAGSRNPDKIADLADAGATTRSVDFNDPDQVRAAFEGVDRALIISTDAIGHRAEGQIAAVKAAAAAGVKHLVYTSLASADVDGMAIAEDHVATEEAIRSEFDSYSILRNNLYAEFLSDAVGPAVAQGKLFTAREQGRVAWVSRVDCARAAAAALADEFDGQRTLEIAGPRALNGEETAAIISEVTGKAVEHVSLPPAALKEGLVGAGVPAPYADVFVAFDVSASRGLLDKESAVAALTGTPAVDVKAVIAAGLA